MGRAGARPSDYFPVATMRLALVGSVPNVTLAIMPGFNSAAVAFWPFTMISVNDVIPSVLAVFPSVIVIEVAVTLAMTGL